MLEFGPDAKSVEELTILNPKSTADLQDFPGDRYSPWNPHLQEAEEPRSHRWARRFGSKLLPAWIILFAVVVWLRPNELLFVGMMLLLAAILKLKVAASTAPPTLRRMMDLPETVPQYPVSLSYSITHHQARRWGGSQQVPTGSDFGLVSFVGDMMHFQGAKTHFALRNVDVDAKLIGTDRNGTFSANEIQVGLGLATGTRYTTGWHSSTSDGVIELDLLSMPEQRRDIAGPFKKEYFEWLYLRKDSGRSFFPPQTVDPAYLSSVQTWHKRISTGGRMAVALACLALVLVCALQPGALWVSALLAVVIVPIGLVERNLSNMLAQFEMRRAIGEAKKDPKPKDSPLTLQMD